MHIYRLCEDLTQALLCFMVLFSPWAFGTTELWSIRTMNIAGYGLGLLLAVKLSIRWGKGYLPPRWENGSRALHGDQKGGGTGLVTPPAQFSRRATASAGLTTSLVWLTGAVLVYCLLSALNARATFLPDQMRFDYYQCISWLPHSYDSRSTWSALWSYLGLACVFWAAREWLLGKSSAEQYAEHRRPGLADTEAASLFPARLRWLLWLLAINGALLGIESIAQRLANSPRLLFLVKPLIHQTAETQFGPFAYRSNGAQFFNLLWPVCLGFWWTLNHAGGRGRKLHHLLLLCGITMAACPIISTSRAGALIAGGIALFGAAFLTATHFLLAVRQRQSRRARRATFWAVIVFFSGAMALGYALGWERLEPRMRELNTGFEGREAMYRIAGEMAQDFPLFGTGPGTYESVSELYRPTQLINSFWPAQVHNDWLETRITFGWVGSLLLYASLLIVLLRWFLGDGIHGGRRFVLLLWLALGGCLLHARFDFPFQVHSILFLFVLLCASLFTLSRHP